MNLQQQEQFYQAFRKSRAASTKDDKIITEVSNGLIVSHPANKSKAGSDTKYYDMSLPSTGDQVYKCGTHNFETKNLTEFNRHIEEHGSKAASVPVNKLQEILRFQR